MSYLNLDSIKYNEILNIKFGVYHPLKRFVDKKEFISISKNFKSSKNKFFPLPVYFDISKVERNRIENLDKIDLIYKRKKIGLLRKYSSYKINKNKYLKLIFGTKDKIHPGVKKFLQSKEYFLSGDIDLKNKLFINKKNYPHFWVHKFKKEKIKSIAGFHTRNIPHKSHEWIHDYGLQKCQALFVHPMTGHLKKGDFKRNIVLRSYKVLIKIKKIKNFFFNELKTYARYAGPREAMLHAIIRKKFGCTHFLVGRDHAGVENYYGKYESQKKCKKIEKKIGVKIITFNEPFYCKLCKKIVGFTSSCKHLIKNKEFISATKIRNLIKMKKNIPSYFIRPEISKFLSKRSLRN